jgi:CheY-like chemotaxis protein
MRVLVIDDHRGLRLGAQMILGNEHDVTTASSGEEGLALAGDGDFDVVLCDMQMPGITGLEVWSRLPERLRGRFVMWTGAPELVEGVGFEVLVKPVANDELRAAIRRAIG